MYVMYKSTIGAGEGEGAVEGFRLLFEWRIGPQCTLVLNDTLDSYCTSSKLELQAISITLYFYIVLGVGRVHLHLVSSLCKRARARVCVCACVCEWVEDRLGHVFSFFYHRSWLQSAWQDQHYSIIHIHLDVIIYALTSAKAAEYLSAVVGHGPIAVLLGAENVALQDCACVKSVPCDLGREMRATWYINIHNLHMLTYLKI